VVHGEADIERLKKAPGESSTGSTLPGVLEAVDHLSWDEELMQGGCQRLRQKRSASGRNRWHGKWNPRRGVHGLRFARARLRHGEGAMKLVACHTAAALEPA